MKECKIIRHTYDYKKTTALQRGNACWEELTELEFIINDYINQGYSVKNITCDNWSVTVYLERDI